MASLWSATRRASINSARLTKLGLWTVALFGHAETVRLDMFNNCPEIAMHMPVKSLLASLMLSCALLASATEEHHPATPALAANETSTAPQAAQQQAMHEQMEKMQAAHDKIAAAKTPAERQAAMREGMATMKEGLGMLQKNCPDKGMGMGMSGGQEGAGMPMMDMMMKMMDQQSNMMKMPMGQ